MTRPINRTVLRVHVAVQLAAAVALLAAVNFASFELFARGDFSRSQKFALSSQTKRLLRELEEPVEITVFFSRTTVSPVSALYGDVKALLDEFAFSGRDRIRIEHVDPVRDLSRAREVQGKYKFRADENVLVLDYGGQVAFLPIAEMADFDPVHMAGGGAPRVAAFKGEQALTSALLGLVNPETRKVYYLQGHGETPLGTGTPIETFGSYIERQNVRLEPLTLAGTDSVPADAAALLVIAPQADPGEREAAILSAYLDGGGRMLVLLDPAARTPVLDAMLAGHGIAPRDDRVLRTVRLGFATGILREVTAAFRTDNPVAKRLAGLSLFLPGATKSLALRVAGEGPSVQPLLEPAEEFWGETDYVTDDTRGVRYEHGIDNGHPLFVGASSVQAGTGDDRLAAQGGKLAVVGSAEFALDAALSPQGLDFLVSATHWLLDRGRLAGVAPKPRQYFVLGLSEAQLGLLGLVSMVLLPGAAAGMAFVVWLRRRS